MCLLFQPSSHLAQEEGARAKSHTDVRCEEAAAAKRLRKVERADRVETTVGGGPREQLGERAGRARDKGRSCLLFPN